jgi:tRNA threonylcarbamoyl adenosine modification protein YeaZ
MKVLALELSSPVGSMAFCDEQGERQFVTFPADRKNSGLFYENLQAIYEASPLPDLIVVGLGPGSYAGVRIAIATAIGLRIASGARLRGLPSISAVDRREYFFIGDARRNAFVFAQVVDGRFVEGPMLMSEPELRSKLEAAGKGPIIATQPLPQFENIIVEHPSALRLLQLALRPDEGVEESLEPIYLRSSYITAPAK